MSEVPSSNPGAGGVVQGQDFLDFLVVLPFPHFHFLTPLSHFYVILISLSFPVKKLVDRHPVRTMGLADYRQICISFT